MKVLEEFSIQDSIRKNFVDMILDGHIEEKYKIRTKKGLDTAMWRFEEETHCIIVGEDILKNMVENETEVEYYTMSYFYHELGHSWETIRDLKAANAMLNLEKIPFSLFNMFEDARIEKLVRDRTGRSFNWLEFERSPIKDDLTPEKAMFAYIQSENDDDMIRRMNTLHPDKEGMVLTVGDYYDRTVEAPNSEQLIPIMKEWIEEFGATEDPASEAEERMKGLAEALEGLGMEGSKLAPKFSEDEEDFEEAKSGSKHAAGEMEEGDEGSPAGAHGEMQEADQVEVTGWSEIETPSHWTAYEHYVEKKRLAKIESMLEKALQKNGYDRISTMTPGKRLNVRNLAAGREKVFKKNVDGSRVTKIKDISILVDMSGSMESMPIEEGVYLLLALNRLAKKGQITGNLIFSMGHRGDNCGQLLKMPVEEDIIRRLYPRGGSEAIEFNLRKYAKKIKKSDYIFCYTDGDIVDKAIVKNEIHKLGIFTWGLYAGGDKSESMFRYFDRVISRDSIEEVIVKLASMIKRTK